jgi:YD repeat-containing protein
MTRRLALVMLGLLLLAAPPYEASGAEIEYFRSDAVGLALAPLSGFRAAEPYLLKIARSADREVRTLYESGRELRRWENAPGSERVFEAGILAEERAFDPAGRPISERFYREGILERRVEYAYGPQGLEAAESYDGKGGLLARDRYALGPRGELRRVIRENAGGTPQSFALTGSGGRRFEQRLSSGGYELTERYDPQGRLASSQALRDGKQGATLRITYAGDSEHPQASERSDPAGDTRTVTRFDADGRPVEQFSFQGQKRLEEWSWTYDPRGNRIQATRQGGQGTEAWSYSYDDSDRLIREESRIRGELVKVTRYEEQDFRIEELYRDGSAFLRVTYAAGRKTREEFLSGGEVVRVREFEVPPP